MTDPFAAFWTDFTSKLGAAAVVLFAVTCAATARADLYWVSYEGNDLPENEGWTHTPGNPPAERSIDDGSLFIDSRVPGGTTDGNAMYRPDGFDPGPGEMFVMQWRIKVHESPLWDAGVFFSSDELFAVGFGFSENSMISDYEPSIRIEYAPGVYHSFELRSEDMRHYVLTMDGAPVIDGVFSESFYGPSLGFGDLASPESLGQWDYFRFGVVPEPESLMLALAGCALLMRTRLIARKSR